MPPGIKCRTCKIAKQVLFIESVNAEEPDYNTVIYWRIGAAAYVIGLVMAFFITLN